MALPKLNQAYGYELQFFTNHAGHFILVIPSIGMFNALTVATVARTEAGRLGEFARDRRRPSFHRSTGSPRLLQGPRGGDYMGSAQRQHAQGFQPEARIAAR